MRSVRWISRLNLLVVIVLIVALLWQGGRWAPWVQLLVGSLIVVGGLVMVPVLRVLREEHEATGLTLREERRARSGQCIHCGYNLKGNESGRCPECGMRFL